MNTPMKHEYAGILGFIATNIPDKDFTRDDLEGLRRYAERIIRACNETLKKTSECPEPVKNVSYEQLRNMGVQNKHRAAPPRDHTYDEEQRTCVYFASFKPDLSVLVQARLEELNYSCIVCYTIPSDGYSHLYTCKR